MKRGTFILMETDFRFMLNRNFKTNYEKKY